MERTFIMIKPDGVERKLIGEVMTRFENRGFSITSANLTTISRDVARRHYQEHKDKYFYEDLVSFIISGPVFLMVVEGEHAVAMSRNMIGDKDPLKRLSGTIRGDYSSDLSHNIIHASDSLESAEREIKLFFSKPA